MEKEVFEKFTKEVNDCLDCEILDEENVFVIYLTCLNNRGDSGKDTCQITPNVIMKRYFSTVEKIIFDRYLLKADLAKTLENLLLVRHCLTTYRYMPHNIEYIYEGLERLADAKINFLKENNKSSDDLLKFKSELYKVWLYSI